MCCWLGCQLCSGGLKGCIFLCLLSWTFWCILWCCMGKLSLLNGGVKWWGWMVEHFGCSACFECSYGVDLGTNELGLSCWLFQYLVHFSTTNGSPLNGGVEWWDWMVKHFGHSAHFECSYGVDLGTNELILLCWSFWYLAQFSMTKQFFFEWWGWTVKHFGHSAHFECSYRADLCTNELILSCWSFWYLAHFSMTNGSCTVLCISSNMTLPWVILLAAGEAQSAWLVMIFALGGGTPSPGRSLIKSNLSDVAHESNVLPALSATEGHFNHFLCIWVYQVNVAFAKEGYLIITPNT